MGVRWFGVELPGTARLIHSSKLRICLTPLCWGSISGGSANGHIADRMNEATSLDLPHLEPVPRVHSRDRLG